MILLNGTKLNFGKFPNGETLVDGEQIESIVEFSNKVTLKYENDSDLINLMFVKKHLDKYECAPILEITYMPYSRMDRVEGNSVFTLKYIANFINSLDFFQVTVIEPHSDVTTALLDNCDAIYPTIQMLENVADEVGFDKEKDYLFYPDAGCAKRIGGKIKGYKNLIGNKNRDFQTGEIKELQVIGELEPDSKVLIIDDLCSKGTTFLYSGQKLKKLGASEIYLFVTHCEFTILQGELLKENSPIDQVFTTNSIIDEREDGYNNKLHIIDILV